MQKSTNNQQPLKGSKRWIKKAFILSMEVLKILASIIRIVSFIKNYFDDTP